MLNLISAVLRQDAAEVITLLSQHAGEGADLKRLSADLLELLRDLMVIKVHPESEKIFEFTSLRTSVGQASSRAVSSGRNSSSLPNLNSASRMKFSVPHILSYYLKCA